MRAFSMQVAEWLDRWQRTDSSDAAELAEFCVPILKAWFTEEAVRIASDGVQVYGGLGFIEEAGAAQHYRDARIMPIYEGTTAIQSNDLLCRKLIRDGGVTARRLFDQIDSNIGSLRVIEQPVAARTANGSIAPCRPCVTPPRHFCLTRRRILVTPTPPRLII